MSQSVVGDSLDTNTFFSTTKQEVSDGKDSLVSSSPVEMSSRRVHSFSEVNDASSK
jgi:hypothetical protein